MKKNVSVILCHESDTVRTPAPVQVSGTPELLLIDKKDGSFEVRGIDSFGEPFDISKEASLCVLASSPNVAEEPQGMTFRLRPSDNAIVTVTVTWKKAGPGPYQFQLRTHMDGEAFTVVSADHVPGDSFIDADIRGTSPKGDLPKESGIRKRANEFRDKRKAEIDADIKAKHTPHQLPADPARHPVTPLHPALPVTHSFPHQEPAAPPQTPVTHPLPPSTPTPTPITSAAQPPHNPIPPFTEG